MAAVSCTSTSKRGPASSKAEKLPDGQCGVGTKVSIEFPNGFAVPAKADDQLSKVMGVPSVKFYAAAGSKAPAGFNCVFANESGKHLAFAPNEIVTASVDRSNVGDFYVFVESADKFQLTCEMDGQQIASLTQGEIATINDAMRGQFQIHTDLCVSMR